VGDIVVGVTDWATHSVSDATGFKKVDPGIAPLSMALGVLGMTGMTAYIGLLKFGEPKAGDTVVVAAASGAVGSIVGQISKMRGCRVVGIAGGSEKCRYLTHELGFDAAVDHKASDFPLQLASACPAGIDVYFENVGGHVWKAVFPLLNHFARIPVCGLSAHYSDTELPPGPDHVPELMDAVLSKRLAIRGFMVFDSDDTDFRRDMTAWLREGKIKHKEDVVEGLASAPSAFMGLLKGKNFGKLLVHVSD
jgi:NADPH-dependent curcumin reductase